MEDQIANVLVELLDTHSYADISVRVICEVVPISHRTFYNHFKSKNDVVRWFIQKDFMENSFPVFQYHLKEKGVLTFFYYLKRHKNFYKKIYRYDNGLLLKNSLEQAYLYAFRFRQDYSNKVEKKKGNIEPEIFKLYSVGGISSVVIYWISDGMQQPEEDMTRNLYLMMEYPLGYVRDYYL